ncbi:hypothetical protein Tco_0959620 [Tanacetum coccineum]
MPICTNSINQWFIKVAERCSPFRTLAEADTSGMIGCCATNPMEVSIIRIMALLDQSIPSVLVWTPQECHSLCCATTLQHSRSKLNDIDIIS